MITYTDLKLKIAEKAATFKEPPTGMLLLPLRSAARPNGGILSCLFLSHDVIEALRTDSFFSVVLDQSAANLDVGYVGTCFGLHVVTNPVDTEPKHSYAFLTVADTGIDPPIEAFVE